MIENFVSEISNIAYFIKGIILLNILHLPRVNVIDSLRQFAEITWCKEIA